MKLNNAVRIVGVAVEIPETTITTARAIELGRTDHKDAARTAIAELPVSTTAFGPQLAVAAARKALSDAHWDPSSLDIVSHAWVHHQGHDFWSPAHFVADSLDARSAMPVGIQQMCNGGAIAIEIAATRLLADPSAQRALVTTGDRFSDEGFDRWKGDYGVWYGDGGTACLLERADVLKDSDVTLRSIASKAIPSVESLHRGTDEFTPAARWLSPIVDVRRTKKAYIDSRGLDELQQASRNAVKEVLTTAVDDAGLALDDPRIVSLTVPRVGRGIMEETYASVLDGMTKATVNFTAAHSGHLGAGDLAANMEHVMRTETELDDRIGIFVSAGGGFTYTCAVVAFGQGAR
jgi:3-oxoacyl-[acyl-carrier-protein] synthase-3